MITLSEKERSEKHCCKDCIKRHISCPIPRAAAKYAISCTHKMTSTEAETTMKNKTIEDAVHELDGDWNKAVNSSQPDFTYLWFRDEDGGRWWTAHADSTLVIEGKTVCTKEQFEEAAKKYHKEKVQPYIPQVGNWFLARHKNTKSFPERKYFCIGRSNSGHIVYEDSNGNIYSSSTEECMFKQSFLSAEDEWKIRAYALLGSVSEPKDVIHKIYQALVSGKLSIPK